MTLVSMPAYSHGGQLKNILWIVVHSMETDITDGIAEALSGPTWFGGAAAGTSPHQSFDSLGPGVRNLPDDVVAYHAGATGNTYGLAKEHAGRASFTRAQWLSDKGLAMLRSSAAQTAIDCLAHDIPARWLSVVQVARKQDKGLCTHNDLRIAFPADTTHSDVGPNFPYDIYLQLVQDEIARLTGGTPTPTSEEDELMAAREDIIAAIQAEVRGLAADNSPIVARLIQTINRGGQWQMITDGARTAIFSGAKFVELPDAKTSDLTYIAARVNFMVAQPVNPREYDGTRELCALLGSTPAAAAGASA